jgi:hypothetical protein
MSELFKVQLRTVKPKDIILPEDHNDKVDAVKEIIWVIRVTLDKVKT